MKVLKSGWTVGIVVAVLAVIGIVAAGLFYNSSEVEAGADKDSTTSLVRRFPDASLVDGASATLARSKNGVTAAFNTNELIDGNAYTMWWVVFNNPKECQHPMPGIATCSENDVFATPLGQTPVGVTVAFAAGNVIGGTGMAYFGAHLNELSDGPEQVVFGSGLVDSKKAEIHLVIRNHGPVIPGMEFDQITTFGGACTPGTDPSGAGPAGPNLCGDVQFATFIPNTK